MRRPFFLLLLSGCYGGASYLPVGGGVAPGGPSGPTVDLGTSEAPSGREDDSPEVAPSYLCNACAGQADCGSTSNVCLRNGGTGEQFCSEPCERGSCPSGFYCQDVGGGYQVQCIPEGDSCRVPPTEPDDQAGGVGGGGGGAGGGGGDAGGDLGGGGGGSGDQGGGGGGGQWEAELQHCLEVTNRYRDQHGRSPLQRSAVIEDCAMEGAQEDSQSGGAHGHFSRTGGCGVAWAENEIPGWPLDGYSSVTQVIDEGLQMMMDEGPGGGHYENILGDYNSLGCGVYLTNGGEVWVVQDFG